MILDYLQQKAIEKAIDFEADKFIIRGFWKSEYILFPNSDERKFHLHYVLVQTSSDQGCSYFDPTTCKFELPESLIGESALGLHELPLPIKIAALDASYSIFRDSPNHQIRIRGSVSEKATMRAKIIYESTIALIGKQRNPELKLKLVNVGVVTNIVKLFTQDFRFEVLATDYDENLIGKEFFGVKIEHGESTLQLVRECNIALITGMTLATETLDNILRVAQENGTLVVMFAETGAHFGREYCNYGIDLVVSEPFPFYLVSNGSSIINVFFRKGGQ